MISPDEWRIEAYYVLENGTVLLTGSGGIPARDEWSCVIRQKLAPGDNAEQIASRLALRRWRAARDEVDNFRNQ